MTKLETRRGVVAMTSTTLDDNRSRVVYEGPLPAVILAVAARLQECTPHYDHMFDVASLRPVDETNTFFGAWRAECRSTNYAGD